jgi:hypothetical protein
MLNDALTRLRALFQDRSAPLEAVPGEAEADPEWDELLAWAQEPPTPTPVVMSTPARKPVPIPMTVCSPPPLPRRPDPVVQSPRKVSEDGAHEDEEWQWLVARAKANGEPPAAPRRARAAAALGSVSALAQRLEKIAAAAAAAGTHKAPGGASGRA